MNEVFLIGKVITDIEFKFIINSKHISIAKFGLITLKDDQMINVIVYDEIADYVYRMVQKEYVVLINGTINSNYEIEIKYIKVCKS